MDIEKYKKMTYDEMCDSLIEKYGHPKYSYFSNDNYKSIKRGNSRIKEGLFIHHYYEKKVILLGTSMIAKNCPFEWQMPENLIYCDIFEHMLLHLKIYIENDDINKIPGTGVGIGGVYLISKQINTYIENDERPSNWHGYIYDYVKDDIFSDGRKISDYVKFLGYIVKEINKSDVDLLFKQHRNEDKMEHPVFRRDKKEYIKCISETYIVENKNYKICEKVYKGLRICLPAELK